jgi:stress response protein YsnF
LTPAVDDMLTRFWFQKEHKGKYGDSLTDDQIKNLEDFTNFVKVLTESVRSLLARCRAASNQSFEQEFEKELKQMEAQVRKKLREFDKALDGTNGRLKSSIDKCFCESLKKF